VAYTVVLIPQKSISSSGGSGSDFGSSYGNKANDYGNSFNYKSHFGDSL